MNYDNLIGRPFKWGTTDCMSLVLDFYKQNFGIEIRNYARPTNWDPDKLDLMRLLPQREGFTTLTEYAPADLRPGDVLCVATGSSAPAHFAVYLGDNKLLHHRWGQFSNEEPFREFWRRAVCFVLRHPDVPDLRPVYPDITIEELLRARNTLPTSA